MTNVNESKIKMAGKTPMCVNSKCRSFYSFKKMDEAQLELAHETGICPKCQANPEVLAQFKTVEVAPVEVVAEVAASVEPEVKDNVVTVVPKVESVKPAKQIRGIISNLVENGQINDAMLMNLLDKNYALKSLGGIKYAFLKEVDVSADIHEQIMVNGKARYSTKVMNINGKNVVMTNDLYEKNLKAVQEWAKGFDFAEAV